jgi:hypothetical protein
VQIDPNIRVRGQLTFAGLEDVTGPLAVGQTVEVIEPESDLIGTGRVVEIDPARSLVYLGVDWSSLQPRAAVSRSRGPGQTTYAASMSASTTMTFDQFIASLSSSFVVSDDQAQDIARPLASVTGG